MDEISDNLMPATKLAATFLCRTYHLAPDKLYDLVLTGFIE